MDVDIEAVLNRARELTPTGGPGVAHRWLLNNMDAVHTLRAHAYSWSDIAYLLHHGGYADGAFQTEAGEPLAGDTLRKKCERAGYRPARVDELSSQARAAPPSPPSPHTGLPGSSGPEASTPLSSATGPAPSARTSEPEHKAAMGIPTAAAPTQTGRTTAPKARRHGKDELLRKREDLETNPETGGDA